MLQEYMLSIYQNVFYGELQEGKRFQCDQKKRYTDTLKALLKEFNITNESWEQAADARTVALVHQ